MLGDNVGIGVWKIGAKIQNNKQPGSLGFFLIGLDFNLRQNLSKDDNWEELCLNSCLDFYPQKIKDNF